MTEVIDTNNDAGAGVFTQLLRKLSNLLDIKAWVKISINFTIAAMHLAFLVNNDFQGV